MITAYSEKYQKRISAFTYNKLNDGKVTCPFCNEELNYKHGQINIPHFAHKSDSKCITIDNNDMSLWHIAWQNCFPLDNIEVKFSKNYSLQDYDNFAARNNFNTDNPNAKHVDDGKKAYIQVNHRADYANIQSGCVIEFQHSPISPETVAERTAFYNNLGFKVVWVFDIDRFDNMCTYDDTDYSTKWKWKYADKMLMYINPASDYIKSRVQIWFCSDAKIHTENNIPKISDANMWLVTWANPYSKQEYWKKYMHNEITMVPYMKWSRFCTKVFSHGGDALGLYGWWEYLKETHFV